MQKFMTVKRKKSKVIEGGDVTKILNSSSEANGSNSNLDTEAKIALAAKECKKELNDFGETKLHQYVIYCDLENLKRNVGNGEVNTADFSGKTPLHHAAELGYWDICLILLNEKANIQIEDTVGCLPFNSLTKSTFVPSFGSVKVLTILAGLRGCNINKPTFKLDRKNEIPLHTAAGRGSDWLVKFLIMNDAKLNAQTESGSTALHYAIGTDNISVAKILLANKADYKIKDENGFSFIGLLNTKVGWFEVLKEYFDSHVVNVEELIEKSSHISGKDENDLMSLILALNKIISQNEDECPAIKEAHPIIEEIIAIALKKSNESSSVLSLSDETEVESDHSDTELPVVNTSLLTFNSITEFISSEERLLNFLEVSRSVYFDPIASAKYINEEDKQFIGSKFETVFNIFSSFVRALSDYRIDSASNFKFLQALNKMISYLKLFKPYCREYDDIVTRLKTIQKQHKHFDQLLQKGIQLSNQDIFSILIMPIQRVMRYPLLMEAILKEVPENHAEYQSLVEVYSQFKKYAQVIDVDKEIATRRLEVMKLSKKFESSEKLELVQAHRYLMHEGDVKLMISDDKLEKRRIFLFNDIFLLASLIERPEENKKKQPKAAFKFHLSFMWQTTSVFILPNIEGSLFMNCFQLTYFEENTNIHHSLTIVTENAKSLDNWVKQIRECIVQSSNSNKSNNNAIDNLRFVSLEGFIECKKSNANAYEKVWAQVKGSTIFLFSSKKSQMWREKITLTEYNDFKIGEHNDKRCISLFPIAEDQPHFTFKPSPQQQPQWIKEISKFVG